MATFLVKGTHFPRRKQRCYPVTPLRFCPDIGCIQGYRTKINQKRSPSNLCITDLGCFHAYTESLFVESKCVTDSIVFSTRTSYSIIIVTNFDYCDREQTQVIQSNSYGPTTPHLNSIRFKVLRQVLMPYWPSVLIKMMKYTV